MCAVAPEGWRLLHYVALRCADAEPGSCKFLPACDTADNYTSINNGGCFACFPLSSFNEINTQAEGSRTLQVKNFQDFVFRRETLPPLPENITGVLSWQGFMNS